MTANDSSGIALPQRRGVSLAKIIPDEHNNSKSQHAPVSLWARVKRSHFSQLGPYFELIRFTKPIGVANFYFPALLGSILGGTIRSVQGTFPENKPVDFVRANVLLLVGAFLLRSALCTWNDILDRDFDSKVTRTCNRPLPRGAVSTFQAVIFFVGQIAGCVSFARFLSIQWIPHSLPFFVIHLAYPLAKRVSGYPQVILGTAKAGGCVIGYLCFHEIDLSRTKSDQQSSRGEMALVLLSLAVVAWATIWDTIYAAQDLEDDKRAGIRSTMVTYEANARGFLRAAATTQMLCLTLVGIILRNMHDRCGTVFLLLTWTVTFFSLETMVEKVNLKSAENCVWWFAKGNLLVGFAFAGTFIGSYVAL